VVFRQKVCVTYNANKITGKLRKNRGRWGTSKEEKKGWLLSTEIPTAEEPETTAEKRVAHGRY